MVDLFSSGPALDRAVWAAYRWADDRAATADEAILARLLALNGERAPRAARAPK